MSTENLVGDLPTPELPVIAPEVRAANQNASQANAGTGIYGLTGSGKSNVADTGAEYAWETFRAITLCYAADLGGWGNKRLALIRAGIVRVWDPRNHINPFETMELISMGAWPEKMIDAERGLAAPDVKLILPRVVRYAPYCKNDHAVATFDSAAEAASVNVKCPQCGEVVTSQTASRVQKQIVKPGLFKSVGFRIFDSMTALNEWGLMQVLPQMSADGELPRNSSGGSVLGSADAVRSGNLKIGTGSMAQVGFMQNRTYVWMANMRQIPDQVLPNVITFGVEASKTDDESGGQMILGPKIAGSARTSSVPGWLGNCIHMSKEPVNDAPNAPMAYRMWLTNHVDPKDQRKIPYLAKHRGHPLGMPDYYQDPPNDPAKAWTECNLGRFFKDLQAQLDDIEKRNKERFKVLPDVAADAPDEVMGEVAPVANAPRVVAGPIAGARPAGAVAGARVAVAGAPRVAAGVAAAPAPSTQPPAPAGPVQPAVASPAAPVAAAPAAPATPRPIARPPQRIATARPPVK